MNRTKLATAALLLAVLMSIAIGTSSFYQIFFIPPEIRLDSRLSARERGTVTNGAALGTAVASGVCFVLLVVSLVLLRKELFRATATDTRGGRAPEQSGGELCNREELLDEINTSLLHEIVKQRQAEEALHRYRLLAENSRDIMLFIRCSDGRILEANAAAVEAYGYTAGELLERTVFDLRRDALPEFILQQMADAGEDGILFETVHLRKDGSTFPVEVSSRGATFDDCRILISVIRDISARKRKDEELLRAKLEWERTFDSVPDMISIVDNRHRIIRANRAVAERLGLTTEECAGLTCFRSVHGADHPPRFCPHGMTMSDGMRHEVEIHEEGLGGDFLVTTTPLLDENGALTATVHVARDITARKRAEAELLQAQEEQARYLAELEAIVDHLSEGLVVSDLDGGMFYWNPTALAMHGFAGMDECRHRLSELTDIFELSTPEDGVLPLEQWPLSRILHGETLTRWQVNVRRRDSDWQRCFSYRGTLARDKSGKPLLAVVTLTDITERKRVELELRDSERKLRRAEALAHLGHWRNHLGSTASYWSDEVYRIFDVDPETFTPTFATVGQFVHPDDIGLAEGFTKRVLCVDDSDSSFRIIRRDGVVRHLNCTTKVEYDDKGAAVAMFGTLQDVTELRQQERELLLKNAELERFAYMVSHDLKSPLVTVKSFLGFLEKDLVNADAEKIETDMHYMRTATDRMGRLLDELLEMLRVGSMINPPTRTPYRELVESALEMVAGSIAERGVEVRLKGEAVDLYGDRPRLEEIWQNLVENAVKFMGEQPLPCIEIDLQQLGRETVFSVRDNGIGIDPRYQNRIFGMFDKLDQKSEGSGMGLALVKKIVELYQGTIQVESAGIGQGTCFRFTLPGAVVAPVRELHATLSDEKQMNLQAADGRAEEFHAGQACY